MTKKTIAWELLEQRIPVKPPNLVPLISRHFQALRRIHREFYFQEQHGGEW